MVACTVASACQSANDLCTFEIKPKDQIGLDIFLSKHCRWMIFFETERKPETYRFARPAHQWKGGSLKERAVEREGCLFNHLSFTKAREPGVIQQPRLQIVKKDF